MEHRQANADRLQWADIRPGMERQFVSTAASTVALHRIQPGYVGPLHTHPQEQIVWVQAGRLRIELEHGSVEVAAGSRLVVAPNAPHRVMVIGDTPVLALDIFTPARLDF